jgi:DNA-binding transcriptional ArsR family regulator
VRLLHALVRAGELCVSDLAGELGMGPQAISNQLQRLADRRILAARREGNRIFYRVIDPCLPALLDLGLCLTEETAVASAAQRVRIRREVTKTDAGERVIPMVRDRRVPVGLEDLVGALAHWAQDDVQDVVGRVGRPVAGGEDRIGGAVGAAGLVVDQARPGSRRTRCAAPSPRSLASAASTPAAPSRCSGTQTPA